MSTERAIASVLGAVAIVVAFWMLALHPKLQRESDLKDQVSALNAEVSQAEQDAAKGAELRRTYGTNYASLVRLGKAVPADSDTPSFLVQVSGVANDANAQIDGLTLSADSSSSALATTPTTTPPATTTPSTSGSTSTTTTSTATAATESSAALAPLGASIGPAGLSVMPYDVDFQANYFQTAKLFGGLDSLVRLKKPKGSSSYSEPLSSGRLVTINSFSLTTQSVGSTSTTDALKGELSMTTYLAPPDQGLTGGASATSPVPAGATPSTGSPGATPSVTATVTP